MASLHNKWVVRLMLTALSWSYGATPLYAQQKHSLIIALGDYWKYGNYWNDISSKNDAELIRLSLIEAGFLGKNIHVVSNAETKIDILNSIDTYLLKKVKAGDFVHFHYSGHGQQVADDDGDEVDGYDEALVPLSAPGRSLYTDKAGNQIRYLGSKHLRDDELGQKLEALKKALGSKGKLLITIDACHSGTSTRGLALARGSSIKIKPDNFNPPDFKGEKTSWSEASSSENSATTASFFATSSQELNYEIKASNGKNYGPLSFSLCKAINEGYLSKPFEQLYAQIKKSMAELAPNQTPFAEGLNSLDSDGNDESEMKHWISNWNADGVFRIESGFLQGITVGSIVEGVSDKGTKWKAKVTRSDPFFSMALLYGANVNEAKNTASVRILLPSFKSSEISLCYNVYRADDLAAIQSSLVGFNKGTPGQCSHEIELLKEEIVITDYSDRVLFQKKVTRDANGQLTKEFMETIKELLAKAANSDMLRKMNLPNSELNATFNYITLKPKEGVLKPKLKTDFVSNKTQKQFEKSIVLKDGQYVEFQITNNCAKSFYYSLIEIAPDGKITRLLPSTGRTMDEHYLEPKQSSEGRNQIFRIAPPFGNVIMKLILSTKAIQWTGIIDSRGEGEEQNEMEKLLSEAVNAGASETRGVAGKEGLIEISTLVYKIVPKD